VRVRTPQPPRDITIKTNPNNFLSKAKRKRIQKREGVHVEILEGRNDRREYYIDGGTFWIRV
jgi:hypothetical protein